MSAPAMSPFARRRPLGRAPSPPIWACYEQIPYDDDYSDSDSDDSHDDEDDDERSCSEDDEHYTPSSADAAHDVVHNMDIDAAGDTAHAPDLKGKGKQRADVHEDADAERQREAEKERQREARRVKREERRKQRRLASSAALRPILTIQKSQGFVWNQDLFIPPYIKDRYVASTSPPTGSGEGFISTSWSTASSMTDYEVEVVEIRVKEGELSDLIPY